jgi:hypothetical protein
MIKKISILVYMILASILLAGCGPLASSLGVDLSIDSGSASSKEKRDLVRVDVNYGSGRQSATPN